MMNKFNTIQKYILDNSVRDYTKETVDGLFRAILEPVISNQKFEALLLFRIKDFSNKKSYIQRLCFSNVKMFSFNENLNEFNIYNSEINDIWKDTEFLIILGHRYSAALIWDYSLSGIEGRTPVCLMYNSKYTNELAKVILQNSNDDFKEEILKFTPDRRENTLLNKSVQNICDLLDEKEEELLFSVAQSNTPIDNNEELKTAKAVTEKAKFVAHEIKNNLSIINLYSKIIEKRLQGIDFDDETQESINSALKNIEKASSSMSYLISDLRSFAKPYLTQTNLKEIITFVVDLCKIKAEANNIALNVSNILEEEIITDEAKIKCALMNIIFNAIEACTDGCEINISCTKEENEIKILIENNGQEISKETQKKIFNSEFTTKEKGNGIGLSACKNQLKEINCDLNLVSSDKEKTIFEISISI